MEVLIVLLTAICIFLILRYKAVKENTKAFLKAMDRVKKIKPLINNKGQFTIAGLFALFIMLVVTVKFLPVIYQFCNEGAELAESNGDTLTAFLLRLIPPCIPISIIATIFFYAKPYIVSLINR